MCRMFTPFRESDPYRVALAVRSAAIPYLLPQPEDHQVSGKHVNGVFPKMHQGILELSSVLNSLPIHPEAFRGEKFGNPAGVRLKLGNFLRFDPSYAGKAMERGNRREEDLWNLYANNREELSRVAEAILTVGKRQAAVVFPITVEDDDEGFLEGRILSRENRFRERNQASPS
jgi:hypothetical protein